MIPIISSHIQPMSIYPLYISPFIFENLEIYLSYLKPNRKGIFSLSLLYSYYRITSHPFHLQIIIAGNSQFHILAVLTPFLLEQDYKDNLATQRLLGTDKIPATLSDSAYAFLEVIEFPYEYPRLHQTLIHVKASCCLATNNY